MRGTRGETARCPTIMPHRNAARSRSGEDAKLDSSAIRAGLERLRKRGRGEE